MGETDWEEFMSLVDYLILEMFFFQWLLTYLLCKMSIFIVKGLGVKHVKVSCTQTVNLKLVHVLSSCVLMGEGLQFCQNS